LRGAGGGVGAPALFAGDWQSQSTPQDNQWIALTYGGGVFVALAQTGTGTRVMTSPDGINWTVRTTPVGANSVEWHAVAYSPVLDVFVAVGRGGTGNKVMRSTDKGVTWTAHAAPDNTKVYRDVIFVPWLSKFLAVGHAGATMQSADGITWTPYTMPTVSDYIGVCCSVQLSLIVAVCNFFDVDRIAYSSDGQTWLTRPAPAQNAWRSIVYAEGLFVALANNTAAAQPGQLVMTSPDALTWTLRNTPGAQAWERLTYGNGLFAAVSSQATGATRAMVSRGGLDWALETTPLNQWYGVAYSPDHARFVATAFSGGGNRAMTRNGFNGESNSIHLLAAQALATDPLYFAIEASPLVLEGFQV
jgi:hypothetical protein